MLFRSQTVLLCADQPQVVTSAVTTAAPRSSRWIRPHPHLRPPAGRDRQSQDGLTEFSGLMHIVKPFSAAKHCFQGSCRRNESDATDSSVSSYYHFFSLKMDQDSGREPALEASFHEISDPMRSPSGDKYYVQNCQRRCQVRVRFHVARAQPITALLSCLVYFKLYLQEDPP